MNGVNNWNIMRVKGKIMKYPILILCFLCIWVSSVVAQRYKSEVPYRLVGGKMVVDMNVNGMLRSFIFDTGASRTTLTGSFAGNWD